MFSHPSEEDLNYFTLTTCAAACLRRGVQLVPGAFLLLILSTSQIHSGDRCPFKYSVLTLSPLRYTCTHWNVLYSDIFIATWDALVHTHMQLRLNTNTSAHTVSHKYEQRQKVKKKTHYLLFTIWLYLVHMHPLTQAQAWGANMRYCTLKHTYTLPSCVEDLIVPNGCVRCLEAFTTQTHTQTWLSPFDVCAGVILG